MAKKKLNSFELAVITIATMIGTGLFLIPPYAIELVGSHSWFVWLCISILSVLTSLVLAELASAFPKRGIYDYVKRAFGGFMGFLTGWTALIIAWITIGVLVGGGIHYLARFFTLSHYQGILLSLLLLCGFTLLNLFGVKSSTKLQIGLTVFTIFLLGIVLSFGFISVRLERIPLVPKDISTVLMAAPVILEPFIIWEVLFLSNKIKNPKEKIPEVLIISILIVSILYLLANLVIIGGGKKSLFEVSKASFGKIGEELFIFLAIGIILSSVNSWIISSAWIPFNMAIDLLLPSTFAKLNKQKVPNNSLIIQLIIVGVIASSGTYKQLILMIIPLAVLVYILVLLSYLKLKKKTEERGKFNIPYGKILAFFLVVGYFILLSTTERSVLLPNLILLGISLPFYTQIKLQTDKEFKEKFLELTDVLTRRIKGLFWAYNQEATDLLITLANIEPEDQILDYSGNVTPRLKNLVRMVDVTSLCVSEKQLIHSKEKISRFVELPNVIWIKKGKKFPFDEELFDVVLSIGGLNYTSKPGFILKDLYKILKPGGRIVLIVIDNYIIPSPHVIDSEKEIKKEFKKYNFKDINVIVRKTLLSTYYIVKAKK